jgi:hypothetical protein
MATLEASLLASEIVRILGVSSLPEAVTNTLAAREHWNLPDRFVVLDDHQDGGVILRDTRTDLQTGQNKVYNSAWAADFPGGHRRRRLAACVNRGCQAKRTVLESLAPECCK